MQRRRDEAGQALVETALVMPILIAMIVFIMTVGHLFMSQQVITNVSREGARAGSLGQGETAIKQLIQQQLTAARLEESPVITVQGSGGPSGSQLTVAVSYPLKLLTPVPGIPNPFPLRSQTIMRIE